MDAEARRAAFAEDKARSLDALERLADIAVVHREHRDDGLLSQHSVNMPVKPPAPTIEDVRQEIADAMAEQARDVEHRIAAAINRHDEIWREVMGQALAHERKRHRTEVEKLDLRLSALLAELSKKQAVADGGVVELPAWGRRA